MGLVNFLKPFKWLLVFALMASAASGGAGVYLLYVINNAVDRSSELAADLSGFLQALMLMFLLGFASQQLLSFIGARLVKSLRITLVQRVLDTTYSTLETLGSHRIYASITRDVSNISMGLAMIPVFSVNLITIILGLGYLAYLSIVHFILLCLTLSGAVFALKALMIMGDKRFIKLRQAEDSLFKVFKTVTEGTKELNLSYNRRRHFNDKQLLPVTENLRGIDTSAQLFWNLGQTSSTALLFLALGVLVFASNGLLFTTDKVLFSFVLVTTYLAGPISMVLDAVQDYSRARSSLLKLKSLNLAKTRFEPEQPPLAPDLKWQQLQLKDANYHYEGEEGFKLGPIDLLVNRGETLFIVGGNGSGKSTLAKLICGLYPMDCGELSLDGIAIDSDNENWFKSHFAGVFADFYLFDQILDSHGNPADDQEVNQWLETLRLQEVVKVNNGILSTTDLSQGQSKRLALLQAYMQGSPILVFDEWAADQDPLFKDYFYRELLPKLHGEGRTVIAILHDEKYTHMADKLITMEQGQIV